MNKRSNELSASKREGHDVNVTPASKVEVKENNAWLLWVLIDSILTAKIILPNEQN